ncbi:spore coat U domain-containing protein [Serratia sp. NPDC078593]|uniref:Csu type fimbrial protein n=1 Tax=unclassified Serratia (in: enterobacteria) TaxID=2647522 RepID=UPI0037D110BC
MKKLWVALFSVAAVTGVPLSQAGTIQGNLGVTLTIGAGCVVNGGDSSGSVNDFGAINFGTYSSLNNIIDASSSGSGGVGTLALECTDGTNYTVALNDGLNATGTQRRMASTEGAFISYNLYRDAAHSQPWNDTDGVLTATGSGTAEPLIVYGRVPAAAVTPAEGAYTDTVTMTVSW